MYIPAENLKRKRNVFLCCAFFFSLHAFCNFTVYLTYLIIIAVFFFFSYSEQPNFEVLDKEVEKRKVALQEAKLKAKGLNPDGTPALSTMGGFSPASKPCMFLFLLFFFLILSG